MNLQSYTFCPWQISPVMSAYWWSSTLPLNSKWSSVQRPQTAEGATGGDGTILEVINLLAKPPSNIACACKGPLVCQISLSLPISFQVWFKGFVGFVGNFQIRLFCTDHYHLFRSVVIFIGQSFESRGGKERVCLAGSVGMYSHWCIKSFGEWQCRGRVNLIIMLMKIC